MSSDGAGVGRRCPMTQAGPYSDQHLRSVVRLDALCCVGIIQKTRRLSLLNRAGLKVPHHRLYAPMTREGRGLSERHVLAAGLRDEARPQGIRPKVALESRQLRPALHDVPERLGGSAFLRMEGQSSKQTQRLVARALSCAYATAAHSSFNIAIGCRHAIEVFKHVPILICIPLVRESAMQLLVTVRNSAILGFDVIARMACVQGAIEIVSRLRQSLCIAADAVTPA